jgi:hypothetical protein
MKTLSTIFLVALLCLLYSCTQQSQKTVVIKRSAADSAEIMAKATRLANDMVQRAKDSLANAQAAAKPVVHARTVKSYGPCPAMVKECLLVEDRNGKAIIVTLKNNSTKKIDVIGVSWVVYNKHGERIGSSSGKAKKVLAKGKSGSYSWGINAASGTHAKASVYSIHYKDGSVWLSGEDAL